MLINTAADKYLCNNKIMMFTRSRALRWFIIPAAQRELLNVFNTNNYWKCIIFYCVHTQVIITIFFGAIASETEPRVGKGATEEVETNHSNG